MVSKDRYKIVIIETNQARRDYFRSIIADFGYLGFYFEKEAICFDNMPSMNPDLVISGPLSLERSIRFINTIKMINCNVPILMISNDSGLKAFICATWFSDIKFTSLTFNTYEIKVAIKNILNKKFDRLEYYKKYPLIVGNNSEILKTKKKLPELSRTNEAVIIRGEPGTGKDLIAKAIHSLSDRTNKPFVKVDCAVLRKNVLEGRSAVDNFSHKFYDPHNNQKINFEAAKNGTIFIDEIEEAPNFLQAEIFKLIEENGIVQKGAGGGIDVRIIVSTGVDLDMLVEKKKFRKDLYYRLNVFCIDLPPLRQRKDDVPILTDFFTDKFCKKFGKSHYEFSRETKAIFCSYHWPGNVRELENLVKSSVILGKQENIIKKLCVSDKKIMFKEFNNFCENVYELTDFKEVKNYFNNLNNISLKDICREFIIRAEKKIIKKALETMKWNRKKTAIILNISYKSLLNKMREYNLT